MDIWAWLHDAWLRAVIRMEFPSSSSLNAGFTWPDVPYIGWLELKRSFTLMPALELLTGRGKGIWLLFKWFWKRRNEITVRGKFRGISWETYISRNSVLVISAQRLHLWLSSFRHHWIFPNFQSSYCFSTHSHTTCQNWSCCVVFFVCRQLKESFLESNVECANLSPWLTCLFEILNRFPSSYSIWSTARVIIVVSVNALESLQVLYNLHRMLKVWIFVLVIKLNNLVNNI